jgi:hypothetical protein
MIAGGPLLDEEDWIIAFFAHASFVRSNLFNAT